MKKPFQYCLAAAVSALLALFSSAMADDAVSERIYYVQQDGLHAMVYTTSRTDYSDYKTWFEAKADYQPADYLKNFLYLFPNSGEWSKDPKPGYMILKLPLGNFASLEWADLEDHNQLQVDDNGVYYYRNWGGETKTPDKHYGLWNSLDAFEQIAYSWIFPENFEAVEYEANHEGQWVQRHNTITYYGSNVNDLALNAWFQEEQRSEAARRSGR